jgi:hypothetical protein
MRQQDWRNRQRKKLDIGLKGRVTQRGSSRKIGKRLNKCDISTSEVASKNWTIATVSLLCCGILKEDTFSSTRVKLTKSGTQIMNIANTPKNLQWQGELG